MSAECRRAGISDHFPKPFTGIYVISPDSHPVDEHGVWLFKVGKGENVCKRIAEYATYFPYGSWVCFVAPISSSVTSRTVEKDLIKFLNQYKGIVKVVPGVGCNEWFYAKWNVMLVACRHLFEKHFDLYVDESHLPQGYDEPEVEPIKKKKIEEAARANLSIGERNKYLQ